MLTANTAAVAPMNAGNLLRDESTQIITMIISERTQIPKGTHQPKTRC